MADNDRQTLLRNHIIDGTASVIHIGVALAFGKLSLLLWVVPRYSKNFALGLAPKKIILFGIALLPVVFVLIFLMMVALLKSLFTLKATMTKVRLDTEDLVSEA